MAFDPSWLDLPRWTPVSALGSALPDADGLVDLGEGLWASTVPGDSDEPQDRTVGAWWWTRSPAVVRRVDALADVVVGEGSGPPPPPALTGITDLTRAGIAVEAVRCGWSAALARNQAARAGGPSWSSLTIRNTHFLFESLDPGPDEVPMAIQVVVV